LNSYLFVRDSLGLATTAQGDWSWLYMTLTLLSDAYIAGHESVTYANPFEQVVFRLSSFGTTEAGVTLRRLLASKVGR
jgi:hypothetical protein